jgi:protein-tyrosine phosphatase
MRCIHQQKIKKQKEKLILKKTLENVGIECYKYNNSHKYNYSLNKLKEITNKYHWIHEQDYDNEDDFLVSI